MTRTGWIVISIGLVGAVIAIFFLDSTLRNSCINLPKEQVVALAHQTLQGKYAGRYHILPDDKVAQFIDWKDPKAGYVVVFGDVSRYVGVRIYGDCSTELSFPDELIPPV